MFPSTSDHFLSFALLSNILIYGNLMSYCCGKSSAVKYKSGWLADEECWIYIQYMGYLCNFLLTALLPLWWWRGWDKILLWVVKCARLERRYNCGHLCDTGTLSQNFYRYCNTKSVSNAHVLADIWIGQLRGCNILVPSDKIKEVISFLHTLFLFRKNIFVFSSFPYSWCCQMFVQLYICIYSFK